MDPAALLEDLDADQRRAVTSPAMPLAILAPAGSGKTLVLTRRIAHRIATGDAEGDHVLALTFTRRAATELVTRLRGVGVRDRLTAGTFHAVALATLRTRWRDQGRTAPTLVTNRQALVGEVVTAKRSKGGGRRVDADAPRVGPLGLAELTREIDWASARLVPAEAYLATAAAAGRRTRLPPAMVADVYVAYEGAKRTRRLVDFDDLLLLTAQAIERDLSLIHI